ncbi:MAG: WD-40 repeat protein [candidate division TM6 bacterium GW2011_GWF2_37_49]|nr:MAG: WD-40 repeat protein [candidate division TM6 bacterium GW2011_GWF2_37_49]
MMIFKLCLFSGLLLFYNAILFPCTDTAEIKAPKKLTFKKLYTLKGHVDVVQFLKILKDEVLISGSADTTMRAWSMEGTCIKKLYNSRGWINKIIELSDGRIACGANGGGINIWNMEKNSYITLPNLKKENYYGNSVIQLANGNLAFSTWKGDINVWDIEKDTCVKTTALKEHAAWISSLIELKDSNYLATSSWDSNIRIWDASNDKISSIRTLFGHTDCVNAVVQIDEKRLASASDDKTIKIWQIDCNENKATLSGHDDGVYALIIVDGKIISGSRDKTVKIWDSESKNCLLTIPCEDKIHSLEFSAKNQYLFVGQSGGNIEVFQIFL